ncbi:MAG: hypothetical protein HKN78_12830 [Sphingomonadaceae bacterium]|nr:hypothetical protein [Sphingomonadaceae bacterium]
MTQENDQIVGEKTMRKMAVAPPDPANSGEKPDESREEEELEEGLEESFPASDPPANTQPGHDQPEHGEKGVKQG